MIWSCLGDMNKSCGLVSRAPNNTHCSDKCEGLRWGEFFASLDLIQRCSWPSAGVDFAGEELSSMTLLRLGKTQASLVLRSTFAIFSCALLICSPLTLSKLHWSFFTVGEIGHGKVLLAPRQGN